MKKYIFILAAFALIICACSSPQRGMDSPVCTVKLDVSNSAELDFNKCRIGDNQGSTYWRNY